MLILGIETATQQVGCAIGGYEGVRATFHAARRRRHVETLAPAIEFVCQQADVPLSELAGSPHLYPSASALVALAHPRAVREDFVSPSEVEPMYLRKTDAELNWEASAGWGRAPAPASAAAGPVRRVTGE